MEENHPQQFQTMLRRRWPLFAILGVVVILIVVALSARHYIVKNKSRAGVIAPGFVLRDQNGHLTSLVQFRGKVVVLAFIDPVCTQICPLTTKSMVDALKILGPADASQVQLVGIDANPLKTTVADVASYTRVHEMQGRWKFLTGSLKQLKAVWNDYHVYVAAPHNSVVHEAVVYLINQNGYESSVYTTPMSYEAVGQQAKMLAGRIKHLLRGRPVSMTTQLDPKQEKEDPFKPTTATMQLTSFGAKQQKVTLGHAHPHLLLFFAGWLRQNSNLSKDLGTLDSYSAMAKQKGWPSPVAIDELTTEPSPAEARQVLTPLAATLHTPIVQDTTGRIADGYLVGDLPWFVLTSPSGKILWQHDGWLSSATLSQHVGKALAKD